MDMSTESSALFRTFSTVFQKMFEDIIFAGKEYG
jgi:hypothetical protein